MPVVVVAGAKVIDGPRQRDGPQCRRHGGAAAAVRRPRQRHGRPQRQPPPARQRLTSEPHARALPQRIHSAADRAGLRHRDHPHDRRRGREHAGHHRHHDGEGAQEHTELVHSLPRRGGLLPRPRHHALLSGERVDGLLDLRTLVVRHPLGDGRAAEHGLHHEPLPDLLGPLLEHHAGRGLPEEAHASASRPHDHRGLDHVWSHLHSAAAGVEGGPAASRAVPSMPGQ